MLMATGDIRSQAAMGRASMATATTTMRNIAGARLDKSDRRFRPIQEHQHNIMASVSCPSLRQVNAGRRQQQQQQSAKDELERAGGCLCDEPLDQLNKLKLSDDKVDHPSAGASKFYPQRRPREATHKMLPNRDSSQRQQYERPPQTVMQSIAPPPPSLAFDDVLVSTGDDQGYGVYANEPHHHLFGGDTAQFIPYEADPFCDPSQARYYQVNISDYIGHQQQQQQQHQQPSHQPSHYYDAPSMLPPNYANSEDQQVVAATRCFDEEPAVAASTKHLQELEPPITSGSSRREQSFNDSLNHMGAHLVNLDYKPVSRTDDQLPETVICENDQKNERVILHSANRMISPNSSFQSCASGHGGGQRRSFNSHPISHCSSAAGQFSDSGHVSSCESQQPLDAMCSASSQSVASMFEAGEGRRQLRDNNSNELRVAGINDSSTGQSPMIIYKSSATKGSHTHDRSSCGQVTANEDETDEEIKVCEWDGCANVFIDMAAFVRHLEDKHVNMEPRERNRYFCLWTNCSRNAKEFNARYKLLIHMRVHSGEKPYTCQDEHCRKSFSRLENLKIHQRSHTGEKPYNCVYENCPKSFTNSSDRIKHHKTHKDPKPYACQLDGCQKRYTDPSSLRKHLRTHKVVPARYQHRQRQQVMNERPMQYGERQTYTQCDYPTSGYDPVASLERTDSFGSSNPMQTRAHLSFSESFELQSNDCAQNYRQNVHEIMSHSWAPGCSDTRYQMSTNWHNSSAANHYGQQPPCTTTSATEQGWNQQNGYTSAPLQPQQTLQHQHELMQRSMPHGGF